MKYMGSKSRIAKYIVPIIQKCIDDNNVKIYYEPFGGGMNSVDKISCEKRIANDIHKPLIAMWKEIQAGWEFPMHIAEEEYHAVKDNKDEYPLYYVGLVGYCATFGAKYFGGYARSFKADGITPRDQSNESLRNIKKQIPNLKDVEFICSDYLDNEYNNLKGAVIYADPPYEGVTQYATGTFNHAEFWDWCRKMSKNNFVFISEYNAPEDFECIWSKPTKVLIDSKRTRNDAKNDRVEKLFTYKDNNSLFNA